jgi:hypothetical protein
MHGRIRGSCDANVGARRGKCLVGSGWTVDVVLTVLTRHPNVQVRMPDTDGRIGLGGIMDSLWDVPGRRGVESDRPWQGEGCVGCEW